jgi:hypothetical protein
MEVSTYTKIYKTWYSSQSYIYLIKIWSAQNLLQNMNFSEVQNYNF